MSNEQASDDPRVEGRAVPERWADFPWPDWVPPAARKSIEKFWSEAWHRGPRGWLRDVTTQRAPWVGEDVVLANFDGEPVAGRYLHCWNNIGRVIRADGTSDMVSFGSGGLFDFRGYHEGAR